LICANKGRSLRLAFLLVVGGLVATSCGGSAGGSSALSPATGLMCPSSSSACDKTETDNYGRCITRVCDAQYQGCFGSTYASGGFGGPCGTYYSCIAKCGCGSAACLQGCGIAPADCQLCIGNTITPCVQGSGCPEPACTDGGVAANTQLTCADLATCCSAIADATQKSLCQLEYGMAKAYGNAVCDPYVRGFKKTKMCP